MNPRRPKAALAAATLPTLATLLAGAALSVGCQRAEAHTPARTHATQPSPPTPEATALVQGQRAVPDLPPQAMTIPQPPPPPTTYDDSFIGGAMAVVSPISGPAAVGRHGWR